LLGLEFVSAHFDRGMRSIEQGRTQGVLRSNKNCHATYLKGTFS